MIGAIFRNRFLLETKQAQLAPALLIVQLCSAETGYSDLKNVRPRNACGHSPAFAAANNSVETVNVILTADCSRNPTPRSGIAARVHPPCTDCLV
jgi:hypothetical protein